MPVDWKSAIAAARAEFIASGKEMATRSASGPVLDHFAAAVPELLGGSADLTPSNNIKAKGMIEIRPGEYNGSYMHYGVREHGMAAAINGIALPGGLIPYGGTFLCFSDYCRLSIRLAALIALSRQPMPLLRREPGAENRSAKGGYVLLEAEGAERKLTILSAGSELHLAVEARDVPQKQGVPTAVVPMPCRLLFEAQDAAYKKAVLGASRARVAVEAAVEMGRERYIGLEEGRFVGMHGFGASGKIADVYKKFDISAEAVVRAAHEMLTEVVAV